MIAPDTAREPRTRLRRLAHVGLVVLGVVMLVVVAGCALGSSPTLPLSRFVGWRLADGFLGTPRFDPTTAQTATVVPISVDWLTCAPKDDSWLAPPAIAYTPSSVTITMHRPMPSPPRPRAVVATSKAASGSCSTWASRWKST